jgi:GNAT superfamily N-acetyltransferase
MTPPPRIAVRSWSRPGYSISTDPDRLDLDFVHHEVSHTYWAEGIGRDLLEKALANSVIFGVYRDGGMQVGFARLITDAATFAYLCDVVITAAERGQGLGTWLSQCVVSHPDLQGLRRWALVTRDAHAVYEKAGWRRPNNPQAYMERVFSNIYRNSMTNGATTTGRE